MDEQVDIVQYPKCLAKEDLPEIIEENKPFSIKEQDYILVRGNSNAFEVCEEIGGLDATTEPRTAKSYFIIKRCN